MNTSIQKILNELSEAISNELTAANDREVAQEAEISRLRDGIVVLLQGATASAEGKPKKQPPANDHDAPAIARASAGKKRPPSVPDEDFLNALTYEWITAGNLWRLLNKRGITIGEGTVYNRMRKLAAEYPDEVEATDMPERWRRKIPVRTQDSEKSPALKVARQQKRPVAKPRQWLVSSVGAPANDDEAELLLPALHQGDCLEIMKSIPDASINLILADLPYGVTRTEWDSAIPLDRLWEQYRRILTPTGVVVLFAAQPFTTALSASNLNWLKYSLVWEKRTSSGFLQAKNKPLISHEDILVFSPGAVFHKGKSKRRMTYNPQGVVSLGKKAVTDERSLIRHLGNARPRRDRAPYEAYTGFPNSVLTFMKDKPKADEASHPFAKPIDLLEYLIRTYSNPGEMVLDNTMGSGSTCIAAMRCGRRSIGIELDLHWFALAEARVQRAYFACVDEGSPPVGLTNMDGATA